MKQRWKTGELAKLAGLTIRTLRYYDQIGLYSPSDHSASGHRLYTEADFARLQQILSLKELGLTLDEIKAVLAGERVGLLEIVNAQIERIKEELAARQKLLRELEHVSGRMMSNKPLTIDDFVKLLERMRMPREKFVVEVKESWMAGLDRLDEYLDNIPDEN